MQSIQVAQKLRDHIRGFLGIMYPHFSKPKAEFIGQMIYGIEASQDVKLSEIARSLGEDILLKKTSERLSRNLKEPGIGRPDQCDYRRGRCLPCERRHLDRSGRDGYT